MVLENMVDRLPIGKELFRKIPANTDRLLDVPLNFVGAVAHDKKLNKAIQSQQAVSEACPPSKSSPVFRKLVHSVRSWYMPGMSGGRIEIFEQRPFMTSQKETGAAI